MKKATQPRLPALKSLQVFEAAARHGSVARAADELHVTQGAVSRQVRQLEDALGVALFDRRNRGIHLTAQGTQLQQACAEALQRLAQAVEAVRTAAETEPLVLSCEPTLAMHWLIPRLAVFQAAHPDVRLHLVAAGGAVDFVRDRVDLAIRRSDIALEPDWQVDWLAPEYMGPVGTITITERWLAWGPKKKPSDTPMVALHTATRPQAWPQWLAQRAAIASGIADETALQPLPAMWLEHFYLCLQAAQSGLGVAMASVYMADAPVHASALHAPFGWWADGSQYVLVQPHHRTDCAVDTRAGALLTWLRTQMAQTLASHGLNPGN